MAVLLMVMIWMCIEGVNRFWQQEKQLNKYFYP